MTEIQWIIHLLTGYELAEDVKKICLERIGEVERGLTQQRMPYAGQPVNPHIHQAPGTPPISAAQAKYMQEQPIHTIAPALAQKPPTEIVTGVGNGTQIRGKRKF